MLLSLALFVSTRLSLCARLTSLFSLYIRMFNSTLAHMFVCVYTCIGTVSFMGVSSASLANNQHSRIAFHSFVVPIQSVLATTKLICAKSIVSAEATMTSFALVGDGRGVHRLVLLVLLSCALMLMLLMMLMRLSWSRSHSSVDACIASSS